MNLLWSQYSQCRRRLALFFSLLLVGLAFVVSLFGPDSGLSLAALRAMGMEMTYAAPAQAQSPHYARYIRPFMYRPYYGNRPIVQRAISFFDHDEPWYVDDGVFVRYDGVTWRGDNSSVYDCTAHMSCYDGHNGYDMNFSFEPVLSAAAGTVIRAGWYNPLNHNSSFGLWVAINHGNGVVTSYGHLSALLVRVGDRVGAQWQIGTSGTTGDSSGPHLHMSTYLEPDWAATDPFGWSGRSADPNPAPDYYLWVPHPTARTIVPYLGGNRAYPGATLVDDGGRGWSATGFWRASMYNTDFRGGLHYTFSSPGAASATSTWRPVIPANGYYEVGAYIDDTHATSSWVPYTVYSANPFNPYGQIIHTIRVDTSHIGVFWGPFGTVDTGTRWISLGTYYFHRGTAGSVVMSNDTGEHGAEIAADAIEFVRTASW